MSPRHDPASDMVPQPSPGAAWIRTLMLDGLEETSALGDALGARMRAGDLIVLTGGLGAGKTTFTQALARGLGVSGQVSSPTFVLSRIHHGEDLDLVHVDAYRTDALGFEDLDIAATMAGSVTVVEWGRGIADAALVGEQGSWLDLELVDPELESRKGSPRAAAFTDAEQGSGTGAEVRDGQIVTDFSESEDAIRGTARQAVLRGYGPRWSVPPGLDL